MNGFPITETWHPLFIVLLFLGIKSVVIMGITLLALNAFRKAPASTRHIICAMGLLSLLILPVLSFILPNVSLELPLLENSSQNTTTQLFQETQPIVHTESQPQTIPPSQTTTSYASSPSQTVWPLYIWMFGIIVMIITLGSNIKRRRQLTQTAKWVPLEPWATQAHTLARNLNLDRPVMLLESAQAAVPITWGWLKPVVLLPLHAQEWPAERRELVLMHELTHIKRKDQLIQFLGQLTCALYWFNPLVWMVLLKMQMEQENACDDAVLTAGTRPSDYAEHLLEVVRSLRTPHNVTLATVPMARSSKLAGRVRAILSEKQNRHPINKRVLNAALILVTCIVLPLAAAQPTPTPTKPYNLQVLFQEVIGGIKIALRTFSLSDAPPAVVSEPEPRPILPERKVQQKSDHNIIQRWIFARPGGQLSIDLKPGGSLYIQGWEKNEVLVDVHRNGRDGKNCSVSLSNIESEYKLASFYHGPQKSNISTDNQFRVWVPKRFDIQIHTTGGDITIRNIEGKIVGKTMGGKLDLQHLAGVLNLRTMGGPIILKDSLVDGELHTMGSNPVLFENVVGKVQGYTINGKISRRNVTQTRSNVNRLGHTNTTHNEDILRHLRKNMAQYQANFEHISPQEKHQHLKKRVQDLRSRQHAISELVRLALKSQRRYRDALKTHNQTTTQQEIEQLRETLQSKQKKIARELKALEREVQNLEPFKDAGQ